MLKPVKWSSLADDDFANLLEYLFNIWKQKVTLNFINILDDCISKIQSNPENFPYYDENLNIRKCVVTKHNSIFYKETEFRIEILRLYDTRQNPDSLKF